MIQALLTQMLAICSDYYFDDRFGFEPASTVDSAVRCTNDLLWDMGILCERSKMQEPGVAPTILGVVFDLVRFVVSITDERRSELIDEINEIIRRNRLPSGQAAKLKLRISFSGRPDSS